MPDRTIRERARKSEKLAALTAESERLWWRLLTMVDDHGRIRDNPVLILAEAFPLMADRISVESVDGWLSDLASVNLVKRYRVDGVSVVWVMGFESHQDIPSPIPSELPGPERINPGRVIAQARVTHASVQVRAGERVARTVYSSLPNNSKSNSKVSGVTPEKDLQLPLPGDTNSSPVGGAGGRAELSFQYDKVDPPEALQSLDTILSAGLGPRYRPNPRFYARIRDYADIPNLDLDYQAEGMVSWLTTHKKGKTYTDIPRFVDNWLSKAAEDQERRNRSRTGAYRNGTGNAGNGRPYSMGGPVTNETRESARRASQRARELGD